MDHCLVTHLRNSTVNDGQNIIHLRKEMQGVRDENASLSSCIGAKDLFEDGFSDVSVQSRQRILCKR